jgi:hypothetical protein
LYVFAYIDFQHMFFTQYFLSQSLYCVLVCLYHYYSTYMYVLAYMCMY